MNIKKYIPLVAFFIILLVIYASLPFFIKPILPPNKQDFLQLIDNNIKKEYRPDSIEIKIIDSYPANKTPNFLGGYYIEWIKDSKNFSVAFTNDSAHKDIMIVYDAEEAIDENSGSIFNSYFINMPEIKLECKQMYFGETDFKFCKYSWQEAGLKKTASLTHTGFLKKTIIEILV